MTSGGNTPGYKKDCEDRSRPRGGILIMDSYSHIRERMMSELSREGYHVVTASNVELGKILVECFQPDIVLFEPFINGNCRGDILAHIKNQYPHLPILIVTSFASSTQDTRLGLADGIVQKRNYCDELKDKVAKLLERKSAQPAKVAIRRASN